MAVSVGLALFNSRHFVRIGYSAWASWCTAPKGARGPCNLICKAKTVQYHFWNGTLFDEQVNGGILNTRNTTCSPEAQGSPGSSHLTSSSIQHREQKSSIHPQLRILKQAARTSALHLGSTFIESTAEIQRYIAHSHIAYGTHPFRAARICLGPRLCARKDFLSSKSDLKSGVSGDGEKRMENAR